MTDTCPECGASLPVQTTCQDLFDAMLVKEFNDPAYGQVHMLTVACFMIQHNGYSDEALVWIAQQLRANLEQGLPAEQIRRQAARGAQQQNRAWKVTRQPSARALPRIHWSMTIADVAGAADAATYCALVTAWARKTLEEMQPLISGA